MTENDDLLEPYAATFKHIELIAAKRAHLVEVQAGAERQLIQRVAADYAAGKLDVIELYEIYKRYRAVAAEHYGWRWEQKLPAANQMYAQARRLRLHRPGPGGTWTGEFPLAEADRYPGPGDSVVYVLFDDCNEPVYAGSTEQFSTRLRAHARQGKKFVRWLACPCPDREAAYALEDRLLKEHKPRLNNRAGR